MRTFSSMESSLFVDIGNSTVNWDSNNTYHSVEVRDFKVGLLPPYQYCVVSCVANSHLLSAFKSAKIIQPQPYKDLIFDYDFNQLGVDRFLAVIAAYEQHLGQDAMIIDIGTFITIDYIKGNQHMSGGITPGIDKLQQMGNFQGIDSKNAWQVGTYEMVLAYIEKQCASFKGKILITGGGQTLVNIACADYHQNLVIQGLKILHD